MKQLAFLMLVVVCSLSMGSAEEKQSFPQHTQALLNLIGKKETASELAEFVKKHSLVRSLAKGDVNLSNEDQGVDVLFRDAKVWRIILCPQQFKGKLPFGVDRDLSPKAFYAKYRSHLGKDYPKDPEPWFISRRGGFQFVFCYNDKGEFWGVILQKDAGPNRI